jgi:hypothetical protein
MAARRACAAASETEAAARPRTAGKDYRRARSGRCFQSCVGGCVCGCPPAELCIPALQFGCRLCSDMVCLIGSDILYRTTGVNLCTPILVDLGEFMFALLLVV